MTYRKRLREAFTDEELKYTYAVPYDATDHDGHNMRLAMTASLTQHAVARLKTVHAADLACGRVAVVRDLSPQWWRWELGDIAAPGYPHYGAIEDTIHHIPHVDVLVMSEILEHLDEPEFVLRAARKKTDRLILTTPIGEGRYDLGDDMINPEHYWGWDQDAVQDMLYATGWKKIVAQVDLKLRDERIAPTQMWSML